MREPLSDSKRSRIFSRSRNAYISGVPSAPDVLHEEAGEAGVVQQARELGEDDAEVFGALGHGLAGELLDGERVGPVVRHRAEVVEPVGVGHRPEVGGVLADLLVVAVQVAEDGLELHDRLAVERDHHAEHAVRRRVVRPHRDLEQVAVEFVVHGADVGAGPAGGAGAKAERQTGNRLMAWAASGAEGSSRLVGPVIRRRNWVMRLRAVQHVAVRRGLPLVVVGLDVVLAHRMILELVPHQDAAQVGVALEDDAVEVEHLALLELARAPDRRERRQRDLVGAVAGAQPEDHRPVLRSAIE